MGKGALSKCFTGQFFKGPPNRVLLSFPPRFWPHTAMIQLFTIGSHLFQHRYGIIYT